MRSEPVRPPMSNDAQSLLDWGACLAAHEGWLRKVILARTGEPQAVDEVFQRVALAAIDRGGSITDPTRIGPWLHRVAVVQSIRHRRKHGRERRAVSRFANRQLHLGNGFADDVLALLLARERTQQVRESLLRLSGADAEILLLKYGERWSYRQIAERLGITEKAVDTRLQRARARLRKQLNEIGIDER